jgi:hypothetical protein
MQAAIKKGHQEIGGPEILKVVTSRGEQLIRWNREENGDRAHQLWQPYLALRELSIQ